MKRYLLLILLTGCQTVPVQRYKRDCENPCRRGWVMETKGTDCWCREGK